MSAPSPRNERFECLLVGAKRPSSSRRLNGRDGRKAAQSARLRYSPEAEGLPFGETSLPCRSCHLRDRFTKATTESITGTSTSTPTTVARAAPELMPNSEIAGATASSKFDARSALPGAAMHQTTPTCIGDDGSLSQTLGTTAGEAYTLSFWLANNSNAPVNFFQVYFGGALLQTFTSPPFPNSGAYQQFSYGVIGAGGPTTLEFRYRHDDDFWRLDDVSVESGAVPEPTTWAMMLLGFGAVGYSMRRKRKVTYATA